VHSSIGHLIPLNTVLKSSYNGKFTLCAFYYNFKGGESTDCRGGRKPWGREEASRAGRPGSVNGAMRDPDHRPPWCIIRADSTGQGCSQQDHQGALDWSLATFAGGWVQPKLEVHGITSGVKRT
jgi:hypothetical protein